MRNSRSRAFTLAEILITIGIIVLLISLLIPAVMRANKSGMRARISGDFQTIAMALEAYKQDFGDIPRLPTYSSSPPPSTYAGNPMTNTGAAILGKALLGPYGDGVLPTGPDTTDPPAYQNTIQYHPGDCVQDGAAQQWVVVLDVVGVTPAPNDPHWQTFPATDNSDGPGFKVRVGAAKVWGPYIQPGKIKNEGVDLLDATGSPILYFPAHLGSIDVTQKNTNSDPTPSAQPYVDMNPPGSLMTSLYDASDNLQAFYRLNETSSSTNDSIATSRIRMMLGDYNCNGFIESTPATPEISETAVKQEYLLWSAGPDGMFGPAAPVGFAWPSAPLTLTPDILKVRKLVDQCDDVTNFK